MDLNQNNNEKIIIILIIIKIKINDMIFEENNKNDINECKNIFVIVDLKNNFDDDKKNI